MQERLRIKRQKFGRICNSEKSSRNYPKNKEKLVPSKPDDFKNMLKITDVRGVNRAFKKQKKALVSARLFLRTKSNLLETLVTSRLPEIFFVFSSEILIHCHCEPSDVSV